MMLWYGSEMSGWAYAGMAIGMVLFWTALIVGGVVLLQQVFGTNNAESIRMRDTDSARCILAAKFARGEIDENQFRRQIATLREANDSHPGEGTCHDITTTNSIQDKDVRAHLGSILIDSSAHRGREARAYAHATFGVHRHQRQCVDVGARRIRSPDGLSHHRSAPMVAWTDSSSGIDAGMVDGVQGSGTDGLPGYLSVHGTQARRHDALVANPVSSDDIGRPVLDIYRLDPPRGEVSHSSTSQGPDLSRTT